jgi:hypothetical protein
MDFNLVSRRVDEDFKELDALSCAKVCEVLIHLTPECWLVAHRSSQDFYIANIRVTDCSIR